MIKYIGYYLLQCTWGILQNLVGLIMYIVTAGAKKEFSDGRFFITSIGKRWGGLSLGMFIFVNSDISGNIREDMLSHEKGHTVQSLILGIFYLPFIGLPSAVWYLFFERYRARHNIPYSALYTEKWADYLGKKYFPADRTKKI